MTAVVPVFAKTPNPTPRYNLIREDSEGYSKLITLFNHFGAGALTDRVRDSWGVGVRRGVRKVGEKERTRCWRTGGKTMAGSSRAGLGMVRHSSCSLAWRTLG